MISDRDTRDLEVPADDDQLATDEMEASLISLGMRSVASNLTPNYTFAS